MKTNRTVKNAFLGIGLSLLCLLFLLPYLWMIGSAFKARSEMFAYIFPVSWKTFIPLDPTLENFRTLVEMDFLRNVYNSLLLSAVTVLGSLFVCSSMSYIFARFTFKGAKALYAIVIFTMMVPFEARMIPTFLVVQNLGLGDTFTALWLPWLVDAFQIMLFTNHFSQIPSDLHNAAVIDGCPHYKIFYLVMLPNIVPALISGGLIKFFFAWDSYVWPLIILRRPDWQVLGVAIANLFTDQSIAWELVFASSLVSTVPVLILFLLLQKYYIAGMTSGSVKE
ncbi:ABC-type sugar transport system, permease component [Sphaerochaeta pleomorpha str. Grapes]|uniref:ABC-type sugar transport system, permease component n=1 Tax=Sphaerochaeta pleomorpha (strain ATCC BAA-1885 / DSM 22778 / Grapes) TaxID=158190 RepID=G8QWS4_SPHPG|nr:carbohydrate ABC transporter permease [Sphaerochaeta pleomorpha]AEV28368.1 ABC-type sugar transport system, permease component [Sphaerochaeta pleomorpha str. Grapes]